VGHARRAPFSQAGVDQPGQGWQLVFFVFFENIFTNFGCLKIFFAED